MSAEQVVPPKLAADRALPAADLAWLRPTAVIEITAYEDIRDALHSPDLSRAFDRRSYAEGNPGDGTVSTAHGELHRARRRVENTQFRPERLRTDEFEVLPGFVHAMLDRLIIAERVDLAAVGPLISVVPAARRAGLDIDQTSEAELRRLVGLVDVFSHGLGPAILEMPDPEAARARVLAALAEFERDFVRPAWQRRQTLIEQRRAEGTAEADIARDILTALLLHRDDPAMGLAEGSRIVREVATYLQGGTHSSAQTLLNALDLLFPIAARDAGLWARISGDRGYAARCVHETLRLRPITPLIKRRAEMDTVIAGTTVPAGALVVLNAGRANRDREVFGADAEGFNPDRPLPATVPRWGLAFGLGAHQCPGRTTAVGLPIPLDFTPRPSQLYGSATLMLQEVARRGVKPDPERPPVLDRRSERANQWLEFPVVFAAAQRPQVEQEEK